MCPRVAPGMWPLVLEKGSNRNGIIIDIIISIIDIIISTRIIYLVIGIAICIISCIFTGQKKPEIFRKNQK